MICEYCNEREAKYQMKNGKWCCKKDYRACIGRIATQKGFTILEELKLKNNIQYLKELDSSILKIKPPRSRKIIRICCECEKERIVSLGDILMTKRNKFLCMSCSRIGDRNPAKLEKTRKKLSRKGVKDTSYATSEWRKQFSENRKGSGNPMFNKKQKSESRRKIRLSSIQRIQKNLKNGGQIIPAYNPEACKLIDEYGKQHGYNFQHAENGGEYHIKDLGYWVDGYDKDKNVVIEVDESHHFDHNEQLFERDIKRQQEIVDYLNCEFVRIRI